MSNGGPKAPKDPTKKRPSIFVLYDKTVEAYKMPEGGCVCPLFLDNGRLANYAKTIGKTEDEELLELLKSAEGFRKLVHSVGVSVACENKEQEAEFVLHMYGASDVYQSGTKHVTKVITNGSEVEIPLSEIDWYGDDTCVGQFAFRFKGEGEVATICVRLYLNDGYTAPEFVPDAPVDFESEAYKEMIAKSFVSLGNNVRLKRAIEKAKALAKEIPNSFIPGQFTNPANARAHWDSTGPEIYQDTDGKVDLFVAGIGTGGTITGVGTYLKSKNPAIQVIGVEPASSAVLSGGKPGPHGLQGIGAGFVPEVLDTKVYDAIIPVSDADAFAMGRMLGKQEGLLVGISSGAAAFAAVELAKRPEYAGKTIVVLLPDTGDRYLSTALFQEE